ncbi:MAG: RNA 2',3'-cyclic phosphodiesterase [candidate division WOR-3 bacterium]
MRTFIAIDIPDELKEKIYNAFNREREKIKGVKWVEKENLHITLKFLGEIKEEKVKEVEKILDELSNKFKSFEIKLGELGGFPEFKNPRVLWIGVSPYEKMEEIFNFIEERIESINIEKEERKFHPHITIARIKERKGVSFEKKKFDYKFKVDRIVLFKSDLRPEGPIYTQIKEVKLKDG